MMMPFAVRGYFADQGQCEDWGKSKQFTANPSDLFYLNVVNKSGGLVYIELYDSAAGVSGAARVLPCPDIAAGGFAQWTELRMRAGIFVRAVATVGGALISGNDVKFDCGFGDRAV